jgi:hypothetical protein
MAGTKPRNILYISRKLNDIGLWARLKEDVVRLWTATQDRYLIAVPDQRSEIGALLLAASNLLWLKLSHGIDGME